MSKLNNSKNQQPNQRDFVGEYNEIMKFANRTVRIPKKQGNSGHIIEKFSLVEETLSPISTNNTTCIN
jgi:hypothetical protein